MDLKQKNLSELSNTDDVSFLHVDRIFLLVIYWNFVNVLLIIWVAPQVRIHRVSFCLWQKWKKSTPNPVTGSKTLFYLVWLICQNNNPSYEV